MPTSSGSAKSAMIRFPWGSLLCNSCAALLSGRFLVVNTTSLFQRLDAFAVTTTTTTTRHAEILGDEQPTPQISTTRVGRGRSKTFRHHGARITTLSGKKQGTTEDKPETIAK